MLVGSDNSSLAGPNVRYRQIRDEVRASLMTGSDRSLEYQKLLHLTKDLPLVPFRFDDGGLGSTTTRSAK